jgi:hypothetical protein
MNPQTFEFKCILSLLKCKKKTTSIFLFVTVFQIKFLGFLAVGARARLFIQTYEHISVLNSHIESYVCNLLHYIYYIYSI